VPKRPQCAIVLISLLSLAGCSGSDSEPAPRSTSSNSTTPSRTVAYYVSDSGATGLKVRSCDVEKCDQWGTAYDGQQLAVLCVTHSGYTAGQADDRWLRILWSRNTISTESGSSSPSDEHEAYVHSAFTEPTADEATDCVT